MLREAQQVGLWMYRQATRLGLLSSRPAQRLFNKAYFAYKRRVEDPFHGLTLQYPQFFRAGHAIDVGANIGYTASVFATAIEPQFQVWAFEPGGENFRQLEETIVENALESRITAVRSAVGDYVGAITLVINEYHPGDNQVSEGNAELDGDDDWQEQVAITTVDEAVKKNDIAPVAFIKVDVQGYELRVCHGMTQTLEENPKAVVVVEYCPSALRQFGAEPSELTRFFADRDYHAFRVTQSGTLEPFDARNPPEELPDSGYMDVLFSRQLPGQAA
jgi:FkbM family methyltransferase